MGNAVIKANTCMHVVPALQGTLSQGVRAYGLRRSRYRGVAKTHLQHVATAVAINVDRIVAWLDDRPQATTRPSRFAALQPKAA